MDQKSNEEKDADPLPSMTDSYWQVGKHHADNRVYKIENPRTCAKGECFFEYVTGVEVECKKCKRGYRMSVGMELKDGHIFLHGQLVV